MTEVRIEAGADGQFAAKKLLDVDLGKSANAGAQGTLEVLCRGLADILGAAPRMPSRVSVRIGNASVVAEWNDPPAPPASAPGDVPPKVVEEPADRCVLAAPLVGTFYLAPEPGARPFVEVGDLVQVGDQVAIIEAMKLMNPVLAEQTGRVREILVADGTSVEYGQPLFVLEPSGPGVGHD